MVALFLSVLLLGGIATDAFGLDPCQHHSLSAAAHDTASAPAQPSAGTPSPHAGHDGHAAPSGDGATHDGGHADICTCLGTCSIAAAVPVPHADALADGSTHVTVVPHAPAASGAPASLQLDLLPYGIAPPAAPSSIQG
ncbi:MAG TPA: hypothetical protein VF035_00950 [Longimicrobiales bacterium]